MNDEREEWIARRAHELWEAENRPEGHEHEHWNQASSDWEAARAKAAEASKPAVSWDEEAN